MMESGAVPRRWSLRLKLLIAGLGVLVTIGGVSLGVLLGVGGGGEGPPSSLRTAVIVDQLSLTQPNPDFIAAASATLARAGYRVDYVPGERVTVEFYRKLPSRGYDIVILRVHSGITTEVSLESGERVEKEYVSLFTGEPYRPDKYREEQLNRLGRALYYEGADPLFGIGPAFIEESMEGDFQGALIIMMGCDGLRSRRTAEAFLARGASAFVSWSKPVSAAHTDMATERLLEAILEEGLDVREAVARTAAEVGPDPSYKAELRILTAEG